MYKKIFLNVIIILISGIMILSIMTYINTKSIYFDSVENNLISSAKLIANQIDDKNQLDDMIDINNVREFSRLTNARLTIMSTEGVVLYDSDKSAKKMEYHGDRPEVINALNNTIQREIRHSNTLKVDMMYVATPIINDDKILGVVRVSKALNDLRPIIMESLWNIFVSILFSLIIALIISHIVIKNITRPLEETNQFAREISRGNYGNRLRMIRDDEIGGLSRSLNHMAQQLEYSFRELSQRNTELESVLSNINNGIIAIDKDQKIILINNSAFKMFNLPMSKKVIGKNILEVIRTHEFYQSINGLDFSLKDELRMVEISIGERIYRISMNSIQESDDYDGFIIVIEEITQIRKLENIRRDFVANVSHELKTPITSIKGFIETLKEGSITEDDTRNKFYHIIEFEVDRLIRLVEDILTLSYLDSQPTNNISANQTINVYHEMNNIYLLMNKIAKDKNIELKIDLAENMEDIPFDPKNFKQLMINLIDNAIKYNQSGGFVIVEIFTEDYSTIIKVKDNGLGISKKEQRRIFERFYRVDKGRSRQAGGTGLGLAIVKHILQIENCKIMVDSKYGEGTTFTITIQHT